MGIDPKEPLEDVLHFALKLLGERSTDIGGEDILVIQLLLHPCHQVVDVLGSRALDGLLDVHPIRPVILVLRACRHARAGVARAEFCDAAVEQVDLVEEVDCVDSQPLVPVLPFRQHNCLMQVSCSQRCLDRRFCILVELVKLGALLEVLLGTESLVLVPEDCFQHVDLPMRLRGSLNILRVRKVLVNVLRERKVHLSLIEHCVVESDQPRVLIAPMRLTGRAAEVVEP
mmetsp:Transcript_23730/g.77254  ORF Transcript_23730/g.77254 Transcript_23730/m.77254 type:complete len:229 (-) Transcript_23730:6-692(-)